MNYDKINFLDDIATILHEFTVFEINCLTKLGYYGYYCSQINRRADTQLLDFKAMRSIFEKKSRMYMIVL